MASGKAGSEWTSVVSLIRDLKECGVDLDGYLEPQQRAQVLAFSALIARQLEPATLYTTWNEAESYWKHSRAVYGRDLPFPLNYIVPWTQRRAAAKMLAGKNREEIYEQARQCYQAIADQIKKANGQYFLGNSPSSVDALLYGHLALHLSAPISAPELRDAVDSRPVLRKYAENLAREFSTPLPPAPAASSSPEWTARAEAAASESKPRPSTEATQQEKERQRRNYIWLGCAGLALTAYVLFSGQVVEFEFVDEDDGDVEE